MPGARLHTPPATAWLRAAGRGVAVVATWLTALGIGVAGFLSGSQPRFYEGITFGLAFAIASAFAGVAALAVGGRGRLAIEGAAAIVSAVLLVAGAVAGMLWLAPISTQYVAGLGSQEVVFYRGQLAAIVGDFARPRFPTGPILGLAAGAVAGLLMRLGRRRPGLAAGLAVGLLVIVAASAGGAGRIVADVVLESRKERGKWAVSWLNPIEVAGTVGAVAGSVFGSVAACGALRGRRARPADLGEGHPS